MLVNASAFAQDKSTKDGLDPADWVYKLDDGVTSREVTYYSDDVADYAKVFFPKNFDPKGKTPAILLRHLIGTRLGGHAGPSAE